jgi:hypothetical protein
MGRESLVGYIGSVRAAQIDNLDPTIFDLNPAVVFRHMRMVNYHIAIKGAPNNNRVLGT